MVPDILQRLFGDQKCWTVCSPGRGRILLSGLTLEEATTVKGRLDNEPDYPLELTLDAERLTESRDSACGKVIQAITNIVDYCWDDEFNDAEEHASDGYELDGHILGYLLTLRNFLTGDTTTLADLIPSSYEEEEEEDDEG